MHVQLDSSRGWGDRAGLRAGFTDRAGGASAGPYESLNLGLHVGDDEAAVLESRARVAAGMGVAADDFVYPRQVHGDHVHSVTDADRGLGARSWDEGAIEADALITDRPGIALAVLVADCAPIILFDPDTPAIGVVHAGWKGTVAGIASKAVGEMQRLYGSRPETMRAVIGPAIAVASFSIREDVAVHFRNRFPDPILVTDPDGTCRADLRAANVFELTEVAGLLPGHVDTTTFAIDTFTSPNHFSHRRAHPTGRFGAFAVLSPASGTTAGR